QIDERIAELRVVDSTQDVRHRGNRTINALPARPGDHPRRAHQHRLDRREPHDYAAPSPMPRLVVAIDGPAGAGKSSVSKRLAQVLGYRLLDTGAIYRSVALLAREQGVDWGDAAGCAALARGLDIDFRWEG